MKIAVTGSSGFVGRHILPLLERHRDVELIPLDVTSGIDICDWNQMKDVKADVYIHLANKSYVPESYENPADFYRVNVGGTLNVLEAARLHGARVIYFSSYVYGAPEYLPMDERHPVKAFNPYANTKIMCEQMCRGYAADFGVKVDVIRPFNIYGQGQRPEFLIPKMIRQVREEGRISVLDDRPKRDFIHVRDVAGAVEKLCFAEKKEGCEVYNIGYGRSWSVREIAQIIIKLWGKPVEYSSKPEVRPNEVMDTVADISKIRKIGWEPSVDFEDGLKEMLFQ